MILPEDITQIGNKELRIIWQDGHESLFAFPYLRRNCPCAVCVDEWTGQVRVEASAIANDLGIEKSQLVGNYAIAFQFTDGHSTGVYSFEKLRQLCPCDMCRPLTEKKAQG